MSNQNARSDNSSYRAQVFSTTMSFAGPFALNNIPITYMVESLAPTVAPYSTRVRILSDVETLIITVGSSGVNLVSTSAIPAQLRPSSIVSIQPDIMSAGLRVSSAGFIDTLGFINIRGPDFVGTWSIGQNGLPRGIIAEYYI